MKTLSRFALLCAMPVAALHAQAPAATGVVTGRVFNPATNEYVRNAEVRVDGTDRMVVTDDSGTFRLPDLPAGTATLSVSFAGYRTAVVPVTVIAGQTITQAVDLTSSFATTASGDNQTVQLTQFIVAAEREGNAKAIMDQRAAMNIKNVVASDIFGDVAEGNVGEFLKFMPGVNLEYAEADTRSVRLRGLPAKYATVTFDGNRMSNAGSSNMGTGRTFEFEQISINSVDSIEVNKTISADMDADAVAGSINFKSKSALNRKGRYIAWQLNAVANSYEMSLSKSTGPGDERTRKILPGGLFEYSDTFLGGRLGVALTLSESNMFNEQYRVQNTYDNVPTAAKPSPVVPIQIRIKDGPKFTERTAVSLNLDYRLNSHTIVSLRSQFNNYDAEFHNRQLLLASTRATLNAASNETTMITDPQAATSTTVRSVLGGNSQNKYGNTVSFTPAIEYKRENLNIDANLAFSQSTNHYDELEKGFFYNYDANLYPITWRMTRSSSDSKSWDFTQLTGRDFYDLDSYGPSTPANIASSQPRSSRDQQFSGKLDAKWVAPWSIPTFFKIGGKFREENYRLANYNLSWTYVGPENNRLTTPIPVSPIVMDPHKGGNIFDRFVEFPDRTALASIYREHPEYFIPNPTNQTSDANRFAQRKITEEIDALYLLGNTRLGRLTLQGGGRYERTDVEARIFERGLPVTRGSSYDDFFLSGAAKYAITKDFRAILGYSQALLRPDFNNLSGVATFNDTAMTGTIPNPDLKAERSHNYSARLEYYFEPVGFLGAGVFQNDVDDVQFQSRDIAAEEIGLGQDYPGYTFTSWRNADHLKIRGLELEYSQELTFLPAQLRGFSIFANYTRTLASDLILGGKRSPKVTSAGLSYRKRGYFVSFKMNRTDDTFDSYVDSATNKATRFQRARTMFDLNLSAPVPFVKRTTFFVNGRNIFNAPAIIYENSPNLLFQHDQFGVTWTFGVKGTF
ncbi:MAG: TonB-dependent receptor [Verrucomicrobiota bacterium]